MAVTYDLAEVPVNPYPNIYDRNPPDPVPPGSIIELTPGEPTIELDGLSFYFPSVTKMSSMSSFNFSITILGL